MWSISSFLALFEFWARDQPVSTMHIFKSSLKNDFKIYLDARKFTEKIQDFKAIFGLLNLATKKKLFYFQSTLMTFDIS